MFLIYFTPLKNNEKKIIEECIFQIIGSSEISNIFENKLLISIFRHRKEVFLIPESDLTLLNQILINSNKKKGILVHARIKLGFFIRNDFYIGIESLSFLAPLTQKKILLNKRDIRKFIYGKDVEVVSDALLDQFKKFKENDIVITFSEDKIPVGYAKIVFKGKKYLLQNLVDIGLYLRSEKSAF
ncbi:MAG: hypothetical protein ACXACU_13075 [Candidatus Hodarchaeales archaeon]